MEALETEAAVHEAKQAAEAAAREEEQAMAAAIERARGEAAGLRISGASGRNAEQVNGLFVLTTDGGAGAVWKMHDGYMYGRYMYRAKKGKWFVSDAEDKDARKNAGRAHSEAMGAGSLPIDASTWNVSIGSSGCRWEVQQLRVRLHNWMASVWLTDLMMSRSGLFV